MSGLISVFLCVCLIEVGWVASVRLVERRSVTLLALSAAIMQWLAYQSILGVVHDAMTQWSGTLGAAAGAVLGMAIPDSWLRRNDPE